MASRLIFQHHQKALKLGITQVAKAGEAVSWLLLRQTTLKPGENGLSPKPMAIRLTAEKRSQLD